MKILHLISIELEWILFVALHQIEFMITKKKLLQTLCISYDCYLDFMRKNTYDEWRHLNEEKNTRRNGQTPHDLIDEFQIEWNNTHTYVYMWVRLYAVRCPIVVVASKYFAPNCCQSHISTWLLHSVPSNTFEISFTVNWLLS